MLPEHQTPPTGRIGYVCKMYPRFSETFIVTELLALQDLGVDLEILSLRPPVDGRFHAQLADVDAPVTYLRSSGIRAADLWETLGRGQAALGDLGPHLAKLLQVDARDAVQAVEVALAVRERGLTHLHAHFGSVAATVARLAAAIAGITWGFTAHAKDIFHEEVVREDLRRKLASAADVVTVSDFNLEFLRAEFGADADRVRRVYNGLDLTDFGFSEPRDRAAVIAAVGRLVPKKGFEDLLSAAALLRDRGVDFRLDLVGTGPLADDLAARVEALDLGQVVRMTGALPQDRVRQIVGSAAAFAAPCVVGEDGNRDGLPTVLLEAMALGTPCVGTPVTGIPEVVQDGVTGLLVPEHDPDTLADALARLLAGADLRLSLAKAARDLIEVDFDTRRQAARVALGFDSGREALR
ncbi:MAG: glycosyltransferase [Propionibacteriaceae bacterium]